MWLLYGMFAFVLSCAVGPSLLGQGLVTSFTH